MPRQDVFGSHRAERHLVRTSQVVISAVVGVLDTRRYPPTQNSTLVHVVASVFDVPIDTRNAGTATATRVKSGPGAVESVGSML